MECKECGKTFTSRDGLEQHMKSKHPQEAAKFSMKPKHAIVLVAILVVGGIGYFIMDYQNTPGNYDAFAQCISGSGAKFYGAYWCPHCNDQKDMFGKSAKFLPYVECSLPNGQGQTAVCEQAGIESYPTWEFPDGTKLSGTQSFETLAAKTSCAIDGAA